MTEQFFPDDMANGLVEGTTPADAVPADLQATAELLRAAHQPPTSVELTGMAAMVQQFTAAVAVGTPTPRSAHMFVNRITRRAVAMVAVTVLAAGTAAAAAGGALPSPFSGGTDDTSIPVDDTVTDDPTTTLEDESDTSDDPTTTLEDESDTSDDPTTSLDDEADDDEADDDSDDGKAHDGTESHHGKCEAWTHGAAKDPTVPGFVELQVAADAAGQSIDDYCAAVLAAHDAEKDDDDDDESDDQDGDHDDDDDGDDDGDHDDDDDDDDDHGNGNGGGNGNGNGGKGHGDSGDDD